MSDTHRRIRFLPTGVVCITLFGVGVASAVVVQGAPERATVTGKLEVVIADEFEVPASQAERSATRSDGVSSYRIHREGGPERREGKQRVAARIPVSPGG